MNSSRQLAVIVLLVIGLGGALWVARGRVATERANRTVALCLDDLEVRQLAALSGQPTAALLQQFKAAGITHVALAERTVGDLLDTGALQPLGALPDGRLAYRPTGSEIGSLAHALEKLPGAKLEAWPQQLRIVGGKHVATPPLPPHARSAVQITVPESFPTLTNLGMGYDWESVQRVQAAGLSVVARPMPDFLFTPEAVDLSLLDAARTGAKVVLFNGVSVAGGTQLAKTTAEALKRHQLQFGYVELVPQEGNAALAHALHYQIVRTHSISQEEMTKTSPSRGLDRFVLAVTERNIRLCYIRLQLNPQPQLVPANVDYIRAIANEIKRNGYHLGQPAPFAPLSLPRPALILLALGVLGGLLWLVELVLGPSDRWFFGLLAIGVACCLGGPVAVFGLSRVLVALLAGIIFPTLALLSVAHVARRLAAGETPRGLESCTLAALAPAGGSARPWLGAVGLTIRATAITAVGGLILAATLSSSDYMMQVSQFRGVKLAQLLPLVIVFAVLLAQAMEAFGRAGGRGWMAVRAGLGEAGEAVIKYWHAVAIVVALGVVAFMLLRSGNESAVEVPTWERSLRALLDHLLVVRPRTKEFMLGYPALMVGLLLLLQRRPRVAWLLVALGAIGQVSVLNTFCHLHTPLLASLLRVVNGLWLGLVLGFVWWGVRAVAQRILKAIWWQSGA